MPSQQQSCPLCKTEASFEKVASNRKHFLCVVCGEFVIAPLAERQIEGAALQIRERFSQKAREASSNELLVIARAPLSTTGGPTVTGEIVSRSSALGR